jgi:hypothetical protein
MAKLKIKVGPISANVFLYGKRVGEIVHNPNRGFFFEYDSVFRPSNLQISPLQ